MSDSGFAEFNEGNFEAEVLSADGLVLVDFWNEACAPCKQLSKVLTQLAGEIPPEVRIGKVNTTTSPAIAEKFGVRGLPAVLFFKDGAVVEMRTGVDRRQVLKKLVEAHA